MKSKLLLAGTVILGFFLYNKNHEKKVEPQPIYPAPLKPIPSPYNPPKPKVPTPFPKP